MQKIIENDKKIVEEVIADTTNQNWKEELELTQEGQQKILQEKIQNISNDIEGLYKELKEEENKISEVAKKLELNYSINQIDSTEFYSTINQIKDNIQEINEQIQNANEIENIEKVSNTLQELEDVLQKGTVKNEYITELKELFAEKFDKRIQELIKSSKLLKLNEEKEQVESKKISLIGKITGKGKLKEIKLNNIDLKIQVITMEKLKDKEESTLEESLSDLYAYLEYELEKQLTPETENFIEVIKADSYLNEIINQEKVKIKTNKKINEKQSQWYLIPMSNKKKTGNRQQMEILQIQNNEMRRQLLNNRAKTVTKQNDLFVVEISNKTINKFKNIMCEINLALQSNNNY